MPAGIFRLFKLKNWIPAFAGMTKDNMTVVTVNSNISTVRDYIALMKPGV